MEVPFVDIKAQNRSIQAELDKAIAEVVAGAQFILGPAVERFETNFARFLGVKHCVGVNNGTSALHLALLAGGIGPGDEVITTPHTWISTSWAISYVGARPVYVDIDPATYCMDPNRVEDAITPRTKAILPVHIYGQAADMVRLSAIARRHGLLLIEDAAQAHGAKQQGARVGSFGQIGCFSFYPGKNLGAFGEAGAVVTRDREVAGRVRSLRDHAQMGRHHHVEIGFNMRMEGLQGAALDVKLRHLDDWNTARRRHAGRYRELLADMGSLTLPACPDADAHVWHIFAVLVEAGSRQHWTDELGRRGIATAVHYPTLVPFQPAYQHLGYRRGDLPIAEDVAARCLSLPMFPELKPEQIEYVAGVLRAACESQRLAA
jgi:dTDP-4-amino-4,6-dideoxygalactose transaminase